ncbi:MAG: GNAT family N-acetyltransferase [Sphingomonadales bacterium]
MSDFEKTNPSLDGEIFEIREAQDTDSQGLIELIGSIFEDYENCVLDLDGIDKELFTIKTTCQFQGGNFWVAVVKGKIIGCAGFTKKDNVVELKRLYIAKDFRRLGLATKFMNMVIFAAMENSARAVDCWSDTRFVEAHQFYLSHEFEQLPQTRKLNDPSDSEEYRFMRLL